ncbi:MAG: VOC family protein [Patescibacteria group bacterium]|nr:VOC family protein [Patescibacteria group bacterium]MDE2116265.1 VOC family protein [Patescibacteria group bacterium]
MQKIIPHIWFDREAEEAAKFYTSIFRSGKIGTVTRYTDVGYDVHHMPAGTAMTAEFEIEGFSFIALNGGPLFKRNPSISFFVNFDPSRDPEAHARLDELWAKLSEGGKALMPLSEYPFSKRYGWVEDKFGVSWQLILSNPGGEERPVIMPSLMFTGDMGGKAEEAARLYTSVFKDARMGMVAHYPKGSEPDPETSAMFLDFMIAGQWFAAMDSARRHDFAFNEGISLLVLCDDQKEIDYYWDTLNRNKDEGQCGWLHDRFGVSWQITPRGMGDMLNSSDRSKSDRAMAAMLEMKKIDIAALRRAFEGR